MSSSRIKLRAIKTSTDGFYDGHVYLQDTRDINRFDDQNGPGFVHVFQTSTGWRTRSGWTFEEIHEPCVNSQAYKADDGKPNWFLLMSGQGCAKALAGVVRVLSFAVRSKDKGGKGYAEHSWRQVPNAKERYQAALYRHLNKLELGEKLDDESGESHWYHVATNALFLAELHNAEEKQ